MAYRLAKWRDGLRSDAESTRILYVAMTRAEDKLLISGGATEGSKGLSTKGWLKAILDGVGFDLDLLESSPDGTVVHGIGDGSSLRVCAVRPSGDDGAPPPVLAAIDELPDWPESESAPLWAPATSTHEAPSDAAGAASRHEDLRDDEPERDWRATGGRRAPPEVIGRLVHRAIERWRFPGDAGFEALVRAEAFREKLVDRQQREQALHRVASLLGRFRRHAMWSEIDGADARHHEVPFTAPSHDRGANERSGVIDLLYRTGDAWHVVDFKTDTIRGEDALAGDRAQYAAQVQWYARSVHRLLGVEATATLCFLDRDGEVWLETVATDL
jgi:ATP-dependent helicase/nuclease subunit A